MVKQITFKNQDFKKIPKEKLCPSITILSTLKNMAVIFQDTESLNTMRLNIFK